MMLSQSTPLHSVYLSVVKLSTFLPSFKSPAAISYCKNRHSPLIVPERYSAGSLVKVSLLMLPTVLLPLR